MIHVHPGDILKEELEVRGMSASALALALRVPSGRITEILNGRRAVTPDTALRLGRYFGNSAIFWLNLQKNHDLYRAEQEHGARIEAEVRPADAAA